jgi:acyl-CoA reductase-like NAD-dependent aldehyde dehydrogenase
VTPTPYWIAGRPASGTDVLEIRSPFDDSLAGRTTAATAADVETAVAAYRARAECAATPAHVRAAPLDHVSRRLAERS